MHDGPVTERLMTSFRDDVTDDVIFRDDVTDWPLPLVGLQQTRTSKNVAIACGDMPCSHPARYARP